MSIWEESQRIGRVVNPNRVSGLLREYPNLAAAGEALDFIAQALAEAPHKTPEEANRRHMARWTAEKLRAAIVVLLVNGAPNAAVLTERALAGIESQMVFKTKPHVEQRFIAGVRIEPDDRKEIRKHCYWLTELGWLQNAIWPKAPRRGFATTSDIALSAEGDEPATDSKIIHAIATITGEQLVLINQLFQGVFANPRARARYKEVQRRFEFGPMSHLLSDFLDDSTHQPPHARP